MSVAAGFDDRAERVLDAAADLLVRWGYRRVTIEDVARHACIGKGTVYLHFRTKDALFLTVLLRVHRRLYAELVDRMAVDPSAVLPWRAARFVFERIAADEVARPIYLGDPETLGRLAQESATTLVELDRLGRRLGREQFGLMRDAGVLRDDLPIDEQLHCFGAVVSGFFMSPDTADPSVARRAELLEHTLARLLRGSDDPARLADVAPVVADGYRTLVAHLDDERDRRTR